MYRIAHSILFVLLVAGVVMAEDAKQYYELREYQLGEDANVELLDQYLGKSLVPALNRIGIKPVGLFKTEDNADEPARFVLVPLSSAGQVAEVAQKLASDKAFAASAAEYLDLSPSEPILGRIRSELLVAFDVLPQMSIPAICKDKKDRIFELRTYESATEKRGDLKVEMFNSGEVPIFLDCGIQPIFFGQALIGQRMPNLTYMTVYPNQEAKDEGWNKFRVHPAWKVLSKNPRYAKTVSKIHKWNLLPIEGSQL